MYEQMLKDTEERVRSQNTESSRKLQELNSEIQKISDKSRTDQAAFVMKMQGDSNAMQTQMSELLKELQTIKSQMNVYEKADQMKKQLDDKIENLNEDFERLEDFRKVANDLTTQYNQICRIKEDMENKYSEFEAAKENVDSIAQRYDKMIGLSGQIDEKIRGLNTTYDDLQTMEIHVRDFQESLSDISKRYDRLEQKNEVIDRVLKDVDNSYESLKELERRLSECSRQAETLPDEIRDVQHNVDQLLKNSPKIGEAAEKLNSLEELFKNAEQRIEDINSARTGIARTEMRLQELSGEIDRKFADLGEITKISNDSEYSENNRVTPQIRSAVRTLKKQGWKNEQIAARCKISLSEVDLILELPED